MFVASSRLSSLIDRFSILSITELPLDSLSSLWPSGPNRPDGAILRFNFMLLLSIRPLDYFLDDNPFWLAERQQKIDLIQPREEDRFTSLADMSTLLPTVVGFLCVKCPVLFSIRFCLIGLTLTGVLDSSVIPSFFCIFNYLHKN